MFKKIVEKRSNSQLEKRFKVMLSEGGIFDVLKYQVQDSFQKVATQGNDVFFLLEENLILISDFQDKHRKLINKMIGFYRENEEISLYLLPLFLSIQKLGKDRFKEGQDMSIICNKTLVREKTSKRHILLYTDYYGHVPQPLNFVKRQKKHASSLPNEVMVKELETVLPMLLKENLFKIYDSIALLQQMVLNK
jgi:hypothetical protein